MSDHVARAEVHIDATPERVWSVLTAPEPRPEIMFGARTVTDWQPGSVIRWQGEWEGRPFEDNGVVLEVAPQKHLKVTHYSPISGLPDEPASYHTLEYVLTAQDGGTAVTLAQDNNPTAEAAEHSAVMWTAMLEGLKTVAERAEA